MKILMLVDKEPHLMLNPYVYTLMDSISEQYHDVEWGYGIDVFWSQECYNYNIIHIHWPQIFAKQSHRWIQVEDLIKRLQNLKTRGVKIISTCHNLSPHYSDNKFYNRLYTVVYSESDCIIHLGTYSLNFFKKKYPSKLNLLLPHHVYDTVYVNVPSREESIKALNLNEQVKYVLCFGEFRANEERRLIIELAKTIKGSNIKILAPSFCLIPRRLNLLVVCKMLIKYILYKLKYRKSILFENKPVNNNKLLYYYSASDISLIHRLRILNSGNVTLGFLMKNVVVGPNTGNVGELLKKSGNPTFEPLELQTTLLPAIKKAIELVSLDKGNDNYQYAMEKLNTKDISKMLYCYYKQIISD